MSWILDTGYWILDAGCWMLDTGYWRCGPYAPGLLSCIKKEARQLLTDFCY